jgi:hypothetical protein
METLEAVKHSKATLEAQLNSQRSLIDSMRQELGSAKVRYIQLRKTPANYPDTTVECIGRQAAVIAAAVVRLLVLL